MKDNPIYFLLDLTEIYNNYMKEISVMLELGINVREVISDIIVDNNRYVNIVRNNTGEALKDSLVRHIVNVSGVTSIPYRDAIAKLKELDIDRLLFSIMSFLVEAFYLPIKSTCMQKEEKRFCVGLPKTLSGYMVLVPVWFGTTVLPVDSMTQV